MRLSFLKFGCLCAAIIVSGVARADQVENPQYKAWAKFAVGSSATLSIKSTMAGQTRTAQSKMTLASVSDDEVVVESIVSFDADGKTTTLRPQKMEIKKMIDPAAAPKPGQSQPIDPKLLANASEETVTVQAGTFKAKVFEMTTDRAGVSLKSKIWFSDEVPGGLVKMESNGSGADHSSTTGELTAMEKK